MFKFNRKDFLKSMACLLGATVFPTLLLGKGSSSGELVLLRKISDRTNPNLFNHDLYFKNRSDFLDESKFEELTARMLSDKRLVSRKFSKERDALQIKLRFRSKDDYIFYSKQMRMIASSSKFKYSYSITDRLYFG